MYRKGISILAIIAAAGFIIGIVWFQISIAISSIKLECTDVNRSCPFPQKIFTGAADLEQFQHAMRRADKAKGDLDMAPMYWMYVTYKDGTQKKFVLNISEDRKGKALLVNMEKGSYYTLSKNQTARLRSIIFNS